ncbi:phosphomevalonate kinase, peroxisomal [Physcomitrium patens]|uniref:phosphomevalonate kinase n=1 Tax=Physcomitrium patens TaxID=3218 RepID=A0A2K1KE25_PHYPA|nr:phosphomevalonate kinase, peroxisomal-like [Physcomitrium patens]PNR52032.1 hypothetical protein PHYPA_008406 [Physcomitrium patens]|eukprot:XP_024377116.1 phosphomevalonate kinase, peroxisomal-like [Physcomitrella patens]
MDSAVVVSAPGKVLITGAYLVLEQPHAGLVVSTSARFYAVVKPIHENLAPDSWSWSWSDVKVISPQLGTETDYKFSHRDLSLRRVSSEGSSSFVEQAVQLSVAAAKAGFTGASSEEREHFRDQLLQGLEITILGSNDFYSFRRQLEARGLPLTRSSLAALSAFSSISTNTQPGEDEIALPEVAKTGLGSSAAMTTAVVASLLQYFGRVDLPLHGAAKEDVETDLELVHSVAQAAHCAAQGKIGSGFDVSCAVYGSQRYVRFSPSVLSSVQASGRLITPLEIMKQVLAESWDGERLAYALPPGLMLVVGEPGFGGSHTPSMVGAVQAWRKRDPEKATPIWNALAEANLSVEKGLLHLKTVAGSGKFYENILESCSTSSADKWKILHGDTPGSLEVVMSLLETRQAFLQVRSLLRHVGEAAGVPIEPPSQTALLDATMEMDGVLLAGVPGAGGFDAVFAITIGSTVRDKLELEWSRRGVLSLSAQEDPSGVSLEKCDPREV